MVYPNNRIPMTQATTIFTNFVRKFMCANHGAHCALFVVINRCCSTGQPACMTSYCLLWSGLESTGRPPTHLMPLRTGLRSDGVCTAQTTTVHGTKTADEQSIPTNSVPHPLLIQRGKKRTIVDERKRDLCILEQRRCCTLAVVTAGRYSYREYLILARLKHDETQPGPVNYCNAATAARMQYYYAFNHRPGSYAAERFPPSHYWRRVPSSHDLMTTGNPR